MGSFLLLGYLSTAAHGHLDALHLSIWYRGIAFVIDPSTGAPITPMRPVRNQAWLPGKPTVDRIPGGASLSQAAGGRFFEGEPHVDAPLKEDHADGLTG